MSTKVLATLVYIQKENQILMIHRNKREDDLHYGKYNGLGGKLNKNESPIECAIREVYEESGLKLSKIEFKGHLNFPKFDDQGRDWFVFVYLGKSFEGSLLKDNHEGTLEWVPQSDILLKNLWESDQYFLPYVFEQGCFEGTFMYENFQLKEFKLKQM